VSFNTIYGQKRPKEILRRALTTGRLPGGYLFVGPPGVGKRTLAMEFIKALNCLDSSDDACGKCPHCRTIDRTPDRSGEDHPFPDLFIAYASPSGQIIKGSTNDKDRPTVLSNILPKLHFRPIMGKKKVVLLDPADGLTEEAGNMLLKTLEEPPANTLFLLITTLESAVLPTIVSRCQRVRFTPLSQEEIVSCLLERGLPEESARLAARSCNGSVEMALEMVEGSHLEHRREAVRFILSMLVGSLPDRIDAVEPVVSARNSTGNPLDPRNIERVGRLVARDLLWAATEHGPGELMLAEEAKLLYEVGRQLGTTGALKVGQVIQDLSAGIRRHENTRLLMVDIGYQLSRLLAPSARETLKGKLHG